jgi:acyl carrier protein phosphodiesterase
MDESARRGVRRMKDQGWLNTYSERDGIGLAFRRMERRSPALAGLSGAMEDFTLHYDEMDRDFLEFYPTLIEFSTRNWAQLAGK